MIHVSIDVEMQIGIDHHVLRMAPGASAMESLLYISQRVLVAAKATPEIPICKSRHLEMQKESHVKCMLV